MGQSQDPLDQYAGTSSPHKIGSKQNFDAPSSLIKTYFLFSLKNYCWDLSHINIGLFCYPHIDIPMFLWLHCNLFIQCLLCLVCFITLWYTQERCTSHTCLAPWPNGWFCSDVSKAGERLRTAERSTPCTLK